MRSTVIVVLVAVLCACGNKESDKPPPSKEAPAAEPPNGAIDVDGFCRRTIKGANPDQCYGKDARAESIKASMCTELLGGAHAAGLAEEAQQAPRRLVLMREVLEVAVARHARVGILGRGGGGRHGLPSAIAVQTDVRVDTSGG